MSTILLVIFTNIPLGISGDWTWKRIEKIDFPLFELISIIVVLALGCAFAIFSDCKVSVRARAGKTALVSIVCLLGFAFQYYVLLAGRASISENITAVVDEWTTGYLNQAYRIGSLKEFFSQYHHVLAKDQAKSNHTDVHPPGNTFYSYCAIKLVENSDLPFGDMSNVLLSKWDLRNTEQLLRSADSLERIPPDRLPSEVISAATIIVFSFMFLLMLSNLLLAFSVLILSKSYRNLGIVSLFLWSIPAPAIFIGPYDPLFYFLTSVLCFLLVIWHKSGKSWILTVIGLLLGLFMFFSLGFATVIALVFLLLAIIAKFEFRRFFKFASPVVAGGLLAIGIFYLLDIHILEICWYCARNNHRFFQKANRSLLWILVNYLDYFLFVGGLPAAMLFYWIKRRSCQAMGQSFSWSVAIAFVATIFSLFLTSFSRGEMGRLLLVLLPFNTLVAATAIQRICKTKSNYLIVLALVLLSLFQLLIIRICLMTVLIF